MVRFLMVQMLFVISFNLTITKENANEEQMQLLGKVPKMKSTTELLIKLRELMSNTKYVSEPIQAYMVMSGDAHNSEYTADADKRRAFVSGFKGSAGTAVITTKEALLWTDGRYYAQAIQEMDSNWTLMKDGLRETLSPEVWLSKNLPKGAAVGVDPRYITYTKWQSLHNNLKTGHKLVPVNTNLIDALWTDKPARTANAVKPLPIKYSGKIASQKLTEIRKEMKQKNAEYLLLTALDEIAWALNLRGSDIVYNPVFFSYLLISLKSATLFINEAQVTPEVKAHLDEELGQGKYEIQAYENVKEVLKASIANLEGMVWMSETSNYYLASLVPQDNLLAEVTPAALMKTVKNKVEIEGMKNAHVKDAVAVCSYINWLEKNVGGEMNITEISGATKLEQFRAEQEDFVGLSFDTISSVGPHAAIIHYKPEPSTDVPLTTSSVYLCDSGGQYLDGTTDITRTMHFGTPTDEEKKLFTLVLKGVISIATSIFPANLKGIFLDSFARRNLWNQGLDYRHGTGHGVGSYLNVHEGPIGIHYRHNSDDPGLNEGMFLSNEPGYYEDGKFGFRHEDVVLVVKANTANNFNNITFCTLETVSLVPIQRKMIAVEILTKEEIEYLNNYHKKCRDIVGPVLEKQGKNDVKEWLWRETEPIKLNIN